MNALIQQIQTSLLELFGSGIKALTGLILAMIILLLTRSFAQQSRKLIKRTLEPVIYPPSLRSPSSGKSHTSRNIAKGSRAEGRRQKGKD